MRKLVFALSLIVTGNIFAQITDAEKSLVKSKTDSVKSWKKGAVFNLGFSQTTLSNWAAGGNSSISGNGIANFHINYLNKKDSWENTLNIGYGLQRQDALGVQKTDDNIEFTSKYGRKLSKKWFYAGLINFRTQFAKGYNYPNDSVKISSFLAPGYLLGAVGMNYKLKKFLGVFISPFTTKTTFVMDDSLALQGAFGVEPDKKIRREIGGYLRGNFQKEIMKNVKITTTLGLFSNYMESPENIDINGDLLLLMKVNKYITVSINTTLIYDHDITISQDKDGDGLNEINGPRTQFKEIFSVGFSYKL